MLHDLPDERAVAQCTHVLLQREFCGQYDGGASRAARVRIGRYECRRSDIFETSRLRRVCPDVVDCLDGLVVYRRRLLSETIP